MKLETRVETSDGVGTIKHAEKYYDTNHYGILFDVLPNRFKYGYEPNHVFYYFEHEIKKRLDF